MTEVFIDSTFGTNNHGYELYCVLTEYDLEEGKRGSRLTAWITALRREVLRPHVVHTDKDFAEVTTASIAFKRDNSDYNHHLCLWHSLRAIDQHLTGKVKDKGSDTIASARNSLQMSALPKTDQAMLAGASECPSRHVAFDNADTQQTLLYETYEEIHASSIKELLSYCKSIDQAKIFRYFWSNWYRPAFGNVGSRWEIASLVTGEF
ncbi:hypothetical protein V1521DRAFT_479711 [Lipomyces starkeyi]